MIIKNTSHLLTAVNPAQYPVGITPEIAFVGRSNVGKSSIINSLLVRKGLARVGATPGMTKVLNFYNIDDKLLFVDLPGYGYAGVAKTMRAEWSNVVENYLFCRDQLKLIIMLIDIRHTPSEDDMLMYSGLKNSQFKHVIVANKSDKLSRSQIKPRLDEIAKALKLSEGTDLIAYSSETKQGREELWKLIETASGL